MTEAKYLYFTPNLRDLVFLDDIQTVTDFFTKMENK